MVIGRDLRDCLSEDGLGLGRLECLPLGNGLCRMLPCSGSAGALVASAPSDPGLFSLGSWLAQDLIGDCSPGSRLPLCACDGISRMVMSGSWGVCVLEGWRASWWLWPPVQPSPDWPRSAGWSQGNPDVWSPPGPTCPQAPLGQGEGGHVLSPCLHTS